MWLSTILSLFSGAQNAAALNQSQSGLSFYEEGNLGSLLYTEENESGSLSYL